MSSAKSILITGGGGGIGLEAKAKFFAAATMTMKSPRASNKVSSGFRFNLSKTAIRLLLVASTLGCFAPFIFSPTAKARLYSGSAGRCHSSMAGSLRFRRKLSNRSGMIARG